MKILRSAILLLIVPALLLAGAGCHGPGREKYNRTPAGWHVHWCDQGTETSGRHEALELFVRFDRAMSRGIEECSVKVGLPTSYVEQKLRDNDALYTLVDSFYFPLIGGVPAVDDPEAGYASGETLDRVEVWVAFYSKTGPAAPNEVPNDAPAWTLRASTTYPGETWWGAEVPNDDYPALGYELHWQFTDAP